MRVHSIFNWHPNRMEGAPFMLYLAMKRIPGVEAYWYEARTNPALLPKADLTVSVDWAEDALGFGEYRENSPNVYWCSDSHINEAAWNFRIGKARRSDKVYVSIWSDVEKFRDAGVKAEWLPYAAEPLCYRPFPEIERKYDVGFMGFFLHNRKRCEFLDAMIKRFPSHRVEWDKYFEAAAAEMASMRVNLNHCHVDATNMRVFESMAGGNCLLTPRTTDMKEFGVVPAMLFDSMDDAYEQVQWSLDHPVERAEMGEKARVFILKSHTYLHRAYRILGLPLPDEDTMKTLIETWPPLDEAMPVQR